MTQLVVQGGELVHFYNADFTIEHTKRVVRVTLASSELSMCIFLCTRGLFEAVVGKIVDWGLLLDEIFKLALNLL